MEIYLATDHAGFELKEYVKTYLQEKGYAVFDCGAFVYDQEDDYPVFIAEAAKKVSSSLGENKAIIFGGSGTGEMIVANRFSHVRAALYNGSALEEVALSREHNDANILSVGARLVTKDQAKEAIELWLNTPFSGDTRHVRRIQMIEEVIK
jgi:ribose 5-phosphate isomerase B